MAESSFVTLLANMAADQRPSDGSVNVKRRFVRSYSSIRVVFEISANCSSTR